MKNTLRILGWVGLLTAPLLAGAQGIQVSRQAADEIGRKIWINECGGTVSGLTSWNEGENFPSLGIGHFIWYVEGKRGPFEESFPALVQFIQAKGQPVPDALLKALKTGSPWRTRAEFMAAKSSPAMTKLRDFLESTIALQAEFVVKRFENGVPKILAAVPPGQRQVIQARLRAVTSTPIGVYAVIDYTNFKGEGLLPTERYKGQGWGLLQVLEQMKDRQPANEDFARAAARVLERRVQNAPPEKNEGRWLPGWLNRLKTYY